MNGIVCSTLRCGPFRIAAIRSARTVPQNDPHPATEDHDVREETVRRRRLN
jgi:hypothetical protein